MCVAFGVYEAYYIKALSASASAVAWIGSFQLWLQFSMGFVVGKLFDQGYGRLIIFVGSVIYVLACVH
jgi:MFS transporter, MCT family, solute carrier family 16 (monocarboxylic acid transporters), member 10